MTMKQKLLAWATCSIVIALLAIIFYGFDEPKKDEPPYVFRRFEKDLTYDYYVVYNDKLYRDMKNPVFYEEGDYVTVINADDRNRTLFILGTCCLEEIEILGKN